jgi:subtilase family serine protease
MRKPIIPRSLTALAVVGLLAGVAACSGGIGSYVPSGGERSPESGRALPGPSTTPTAMPGAATPTPQPHARGILSGRALPGQPTPTPTPTQAPLVASVLCTAGLGANCHVLQNTALAPLVDALGILIPGYHPADLRGAYGLSPLPLLSGLLGGGSTAPTGPTIAIVNAYDDSNAEHDLGIYRNRMGLPPCTTANGCFKKLNAALQKGPYPASNRGWTAETSLDLAMASAACPSCRLTLIEAADDNIASLAAIVDEIAKPGSSVAPAAISASWGIAETADLSTLEHSFAHPGMPIVASAGDEGRVEFPASSANVISVAGTTLSHGLLSGWSEKPWTSSGTGCSGYFAAGSWQHTACGKRGVADVSVVADLNPGIAVYDSSAHGWVVYGGTSAGAPFVAGLFAAAHDYPSNGVGAAPVYAKASSLKTVAGSAISLGSPSGLGAF